MGEPWGIEQQARENLIVELRLLWDQMPAKDKIDYFTESELDDAMNRFIEATLEAKGLHS